MTEAEWLSGNDPAAMLAFLGRASGRKLRLFAVAGCRPLLRHMGSRISRLAVGVAERYADGIANQRDLLAASHAAEFAAREGINLRGVARQAAVCTTYHSPGLAASSVVHTVMNGAAADQFGPGYLCDLLRDIFGPEAFRPVGVSAAWLVWQGGVVRQMARSIYDEDRFEDLPVLADALEEAGCADAEVLSHCRSGGDHVRGCWLLDLLLSKQ